MLGLMQNWPLLMHRIIDHAATFHGARKVITRSVEGPIVETNYAQIRARSLRVAQRLMMGFLDPVEDALFVAAGLRRLGVAASRGA